MQTRKAVGRDAATRKYDLLTVLGAYALSQDKRLQRQTLRLICLITARYNWQSDLLSVGQTEIARLWSVDLRTVKREMAGLRDRGWLVEKRSAARGRVAVHGLDITQILRDTRDIWERVGRDLVERLDPPVLQSPPAPMMPQNGVVIPFPSAPLPVASTLWGQIAARLAADDPAIYRAWFSPLEVLSETPELTLRAPTGFHASYLRTHLAGRLEGAIKAIAPDVRVRLV